MKGNSKKDLLLSIIFLIFLVTTCSFGETIYEVGKLQPYSSISDGTLVKSTELEFDFRYRTKTAEGKLKDYDATTLMCNGEEITPYGRNYKVTLKEGSNSIISVHDNGEVYAKDELNIICDTQKPCFRTEGIYNDMMINTDSIEFKVFPYDNYTSKENIEIIVYFDGKEIKLKDSVYKLNLTKNQGNYVTVIAKDEAKNAHTETITLIYHPITNVASSLVDKLVDYVPAMGRNLEQSKGVIKGQSTELGTFGGYVILKTDETMKNVDGLDLAVKGSWSSKNKPLYSVAVLRDSNMNGLPDESNWYYLSDKKSNEHENVTSLVTYIRDPDHSNVGYANIENENDYRVETSSEDDTVFVSSFDYSSYEFDEYIDLEGILYDTSKKADTGTYTKENRYEFDTAITSSGEKASVYGVDFIKVYSNALLISEDDMIVSTDINHVRFISPTELDSHGNEEYDHSNFPFYFSDSHMDFDKPFNEYKVGDVVTVTYTPYIDIIPVSLTANMKYFYDRYDRELKYYVRDTVDKKIPVTKISNDSFSFVMPDTPVDIRPYKFRWQVCNACFINSI